MPQYSDYPQTMVQAFRRNLRGLASGSRFGRLLRSVPFISGRITTGMAPITAGWPSVEPQSSYASVSHWQENLIAAIKFDLEASPSYCQSVPSWSLELSPDVHVNHHMFGQHNHAIQRGHHSWSPPTDSLTSRCDMCQSVGTRCLSRVLSSN